MPSDREPGSRSSPLFQLLDAGNPLQYVIHPEAGQFLGRKPGGSSPEEGSDFQKVLTEGALRFVKFSFPDGLAVPEPEKMEI